MHGTVTLYLNAITTTSGTGSTTDRYYYCKRENEEVASMVVIQFGGMVLKIGKDAFPKVGSEYFADSPGISEKIKNNGKGYSPKDIEDIVKEYNSEKLAQNGK